MVILCNHNHGDWNGTWAGTLWTDYRTADIEVFIWTQHHSGYDIKPFKVDLLIAEVFYDLERRNMVMQVCLQVTIFFYELGNWDMLFEIIQDVMKK